MDSGKENDEWVWFNQVHPTVKPHLLLVSCKVKEAYQGVTTKKYMNQGTNDIPISTITTLAAPHANGKNCEKQKVHS